MASVALDYEQLSDIELAALVIRRDATAVRLITRRNNQRLYRAAWSILKNRAEAEEAVQDGYLKAFAAIDSFAGKSSLSTWLTRIVINEALGRRRVAETITPPASAIRGRHRRLSGGSHGQFGYGALTGSRCHAPTKLLERAIAKLPETFRPVFVLRDVEDDALTERVLVKFLASNETVISR